MQVAMIGLGRMGGNMVRRLMRGGHELVVYSRHPEKAAELAALGAHAASDFADLCAQLHAPRIIWMMVPAGSAVEDTIAALSPHLAAGDILVDGGNSNFHDTMRRASQARERRVELVDCGTSGGVWGLENGYCLMVGGAHEAVARCEPLFRTLAPESGYAHVGPSGAGHYVKMIHNGIEYGMLQAYAEGYEVLHRSSEFQLDLRQIADLWNHGSVVRSWLNELAERAFAGDAELASIKAYVEDSGEGRWTVQEAIDLNVPMPIITLSLLTRFRSRQDESFSAKVIAALRREFGGHTVKST
jgi:6-phosphogluconate dehydrogenase